MLRGNEAYTEVKKRKPLDIVLQEKEAAQKETALEERKKKLKDIRNFYKPIDRDELDQHKLNYEK